MKYLLIGLALALTSILVPHFTQGADTDMSGVSLDSHWFQSEQECQAWLDKHPVPYYLPAGGGDFRQHNPQWDCDDMANWLVDEAEKDGYRIMECPVSPQGYVASMFSVKAWDGRLHVGCWTRIGNAYWYIEPETGIMKRLCEVD